MGFFSFIVGIIAAMGTVAYIVAGTVAVACLVWWDEFGKDFLVGLAAIICLVGILYVGLYMTLGEYAWSCLAQDIIFIVTAGIVGADALLQWIEDAVLWVIAFVAQAVEALTGFPVWMWAVGAAGVLILTRSGSSTISSRPYLQGNGSASVRDESIKTDLLSDAQGVT